MGKLLKIETSGTEIYGFVGFVEEKNAEKLLTTIRKNYSAMQQKFGDRGKLIVSISTYNPELPFRF
jgi:hypothetical protein